MRREFRMLSVVTLGFLLLGCNQTLELTKIVSIDKDLQGYVNDFVLEGQAQGVNVVIDNLSVHFSSSLDPLTLGECWMYNKGTQATPTILISRQNWEYESDVDRRVIMFHELGHCVFWREHVDTWTGGIVTSIMYPYHQGETMYMYNWAYYMQELFHGF